jgi:nitric oxide reductase subunit C
MSRLFFAVCTGVSGLLAIVIMAGQFTPREVPPMVALGYSVWQANNCAGCHTIYGQGANYGPDLTHIYSLRGESYLREFFVNPNAFHPDQRQMPRFGLTVDETTQLLEFFSWIDTQVTTWPPRAIVVSGGAGVSIITAAESSAVSTEDPAVARGRALFSRAPAVCSTCHSLERDVVIIGPSLFGIADRAWYRVPGLSPEEYIRNSILYPSDYLVEGFADVMQKNFGDVLSSQEIDDLIAFLMTLEDPDAS